MKNLLSILFLLPISVFAACPARIQDSAGILKSLNTTNLNTLVGQGADPYVLTTNTSVLPEQLVDNIRNECPLWQSASGGVKNNLVIYVLEPANHKFGVFYGAEWKPALDDHVASIKMQFMAPAFKEHDWDRGFLNGINQTSNQIKTFQTAAAHPQETVINQQPTDFSGFWTFLWFLLWIGVGCVVTYGIVLFFKNKGHRKDAQQKAVQAKNDAADALIKTKSWLDEKTALGEDVKNQQAGYDAYAEQFARASSTEAYNPEGKNSTGQYKTIADYYTDLSRGLMNCRSGRMAEQRVDPTTKPKKKPVYRAPANQTVSPTVNHTSSTVFIDNSYIAPVIIEEPRYSDPTPSYSSSNDSWSGSSSNYDSGSSSSWSDSSSSSDFSSGSSDFGGSSSDF